jgi:peroxiredoxin
VSTILQQSDPAAESPASDKRPKPRRTQIVAGLGVALAIIAVAIFVGGREGFQQIGQGGVNQSILPKVGEMAPDFTAYDISGNQVSLSDFRGQAVWLNFWGSWCPPCRAEMPDIQAAYADLAPKGIVLLAISLDEPPQDAALFAARNNATFTILTDQYRQETGPNYPIYNFPTHIFIDADGRVRYLALSQLSTERAIEYGEQTIAATND